MYACGEIVTLPRVGKKKGIHQILACTGDGRRMEKGR